MTTLPTNIRKAARDFLVALYKTPGQVDGQTVYPTPAQDRVFPNRSLPLEVEKLPALLVYIAKESKGDHAFNGLSYRVLDLVVEWRDLSDDALHDSLDDAAWLIERLFLLDPSLGGLVDADRSGFESVELAEAVNGEQVIGAAALHFRLEYIEPERTPVGSLDDLLRIRGSFDLPPADGNIDLETAVDFPAPEEPTP